MRTNVYIDGFNFYYGCFGTWEDPICHEFKATGPYKWVDLRKLSETLYPNDTIHRIHYCTAIVKGTHRDPNKPVRQQTYLRALRSTGLFYVHEGHFEERTKYGMLKSLPPCVQNPPCLVGLVVVRVREEKGSDVNLATRLLRDAFLGDFEQAVVVSNDSDLADAIRVVKADTRLPIHVVSPHRDVVRELRRAATTATVLNKYLLPACQLPSPITLPDGTQLFKPHGW
jgi:hypothetical protein